MVALGAAHRVTASRKRRTLYAFLIGRSGFRKREGAGAIIAAMKKPTEKTKEAIAQNDTGDTSDVATDRAIEAREEVSTEAADEDSAETANGSSAEGEESTEFCVRLSKTNRYDFGVVSAATHKSMQGNKRRDTKPEVLVRRMLREMGFPGYRCDWGKAPGRPDVAYVGASSPSRFGGASGIGAPPAACRCPRRTSITGGQVRRNVERDERNLAALEAAAGRCSCCGSTS